MNKDVMDMVKPGALVVVTERIKEKDKERTSKFKGVVLARKHGAQSNATFTVRAVVDGVGVEKIYPFSSPAISGIQIVSSPKKVKRSKLYFLRTVSKKRSRQKVGLAV
jgi:large subunit ribosomal protein L19